MKMFKNNVWGDKLKYKYVLTIWFPYNEHTTYIIIYLQTLKKIKIHIYSNKSYNQMMAKSLLESVPMLFTVGAIA